MGPAGIAFLDWWLTTTKGRTMNWGRIEGTWNQRQSQVQMLWGKRTADDLTLIAGRRDQLANRLQEHSGLANDVAGAQVSAYLQAADGRWFKR